MYIYWKKQKILYRLSKLMGRQISKVFLTAFGFPLIPMVGGLEVKASLRGWGLSPEKEKMSSAAESLFFKQ